MIVKQDPESFSKPYRLALRLSRYEYAALLYLMELYGLNASKTIRKLIRDNHKQQEQ